MKAKRILPSAAVAAALFLVSGCSVKIANLTPETIPTNPSGIYTLSAKAQLDNEAVDRSSVQAFVVIDGERLPMTPSEMGAGFFEYDYAIPENRDGARFFYVVNYRLENFDGNPSEPREITSGLHRFQLVDRFSISLDSDRAPIGTQLAVLGRGFARSDSVFVGGVRAATEFVSQNALQFIVPALEPGSAYPVEIRGGGDTQSAGSLKVDPGLPLSIVPDSIELSSGQRQALAFALDTPAPEGGLYLNVTTDVPDSVIMPEVLIPEGSRTVNVTIKGGEPGEGRLFVKAEGMPERVVPITVK